MTNWQRFGIPDGVMAKKPRGISTRDWALQNASADFRAIYKAVGAPKSNGGNQLVKDFLWDTSLAGILANSLKPAPISPVDAFVKKYNGKLVDRDHAYGGQCMDLAEQYVAEVLRLPVLPGPNAIDCWTSYQKSFYTRIPNTMTNVPTKGDIVIWGKGVGYYGHIAVFLSGDVNGFKSFDQNFPLGSICHVQPHNYAGVLGWLHRN